MRSRPRGVHALRDMIGTPQHQTPWGWAVPLPHPGRRLLKAWWVLTGRAEAVVWPEPGELEDVLRQPRSRGSLRDGDLSYMPATAGTRGKPPGPPS